MVDLITAQNAYHESKYRTEANVILTNAAKAIVSACNNGRFSTTINVDSRTNKNAVDMAITDLVNKGYVVNFTKDTTPLNYWDTIKIDWNIEKEKVD